jgi:hypothetical protein
MNDDVGNPCSKRTTGALGSSYNRKLWMRRKGDVPFWGKFWKSTPGPGATRGERYATNVGAYHCESGDDGAGRGDPRHVG